MGWVHLDAARALRVENRELLEASYALQRVGHDGKTAVWNRVGLSFAQEANGVDFVNSGTARAAPASHVSPRQAERRAYTRRAAALLCGHRLCGRHGQAARHPCLPGVTRPMWLARAALPLVSDP